MVGLMQIMIYLLCVYLVYKGVEIFQIAFVSNNTNKSIKTIGLIVGIGAIAAAIFIGLGAVVMAEDIVARIGNNTPNFR